MKKYLKTPLFWSTVILGGTTILLTATTADLATKVDMFEKAVESQGMRFDYETGYFYSGTSSEVSDSSLPSTPSSSSSSSSSSSTSSFYKIGDTVSFTKDIDVTIDDMTLDSNRVLDESEKGGIPVVFKVTIKNNGNEQYDWSPLRFSVLDGTNQSANFDISNYSNDFPDYINAGQTYTTELVFGAKAQGPYQISFADATWSSENR